MVCTLSGPDMLERKRTVLDEVRAGREEVRELPDGYAYRYPGTDEWAEKWFRMVRLERECCAFLDFELIFERGQGPIWLRIRGAEGAKEALSALSHEVEALEAD